MKRFQMGVLSLAFIILVAGTASAASPNAEVKAASEKVMPLFMKHLETLVNMDSGTDDFAELTIKKDYLVAALKKAGTEVTVLEAASNRKGTYNVLARLKGNGKAKIMIVVHYDTVWPKGESAKRPFRIENDVAYGPGIADEQHSVAGVLALIDMIQSLKYRDFAVFTVLFNADEEKISLGCKELILAESGRHDVVFSMEGGGDEGDTVFISCRGTSNGMINVKGVAAHSGENPKDGRNAGVELARQILTMLDLSDDAKWTDANWTIGSFGLKRNMIPDTATATLNIRTALNSEVDRIETEMRKRIQNVTDKDCTVELTFTRNIPTFERNPQTDLLAGTAEAIYMKELNRPLRLVQMGGASDANIACLKAPVLEGLGVGGGNWHSLKESVTLKHVPDRLYLLMRLMQETCTGKTVPIGTPDR